jgi:hypothetical protein
VEPHKSVFLIFKILTFLKWRTRLGSRDWATVRELVRGAISPMAKNIKEEARMADFKCDLLFSGKKKVNPLGTRHTSRTPSS